jgi:hypothetical protein
MRQRIIMRGKMDAKGKIVQPPMNANKRRYLTTKKHEKGKDKLG